MTLLYSASLGVNHLYPLHFHVAELKTFLPPANEVWGKVIFLHQFVILLTGGCAWLPGGMRGCSGGDMRCCSGGACVVAPGGHVWFFLGGHVWFFPGGHVWFFSEGACMVFSGGHA